MALACGHNLIAMGGRMSTLGNLINFEMDATGQLVCLQSLSTPGNSSMSLANKE